MWPVLTDRSAIIQACLDVMRKTEAVLVTSLDESGAPCPRAMFNLRRESQFPGLRDVFADGDARLLVYLSTNTSSEKVRQLMRDSRLALYYCLPSQTCGVMLSGRAAFVSEPEIKRAIWQPGWEIYFPMGTEDPDYTILRLLPSRVKGWLGDRSFDTPLELPS